MIKSRKYLKAAGLGTLSFAACTLVFEYDLKRGRIVWKEHGEKRFLAKKRKLTLEGLVHPDDWPFVLQQFEDLKRERFYTEETRLLDAAGNYRPCSLRLAVVKAAGGRPVLAVGIIHELDGCPQEKRVI